MRSPALSHDHLVWACVWMSKRHLILSTSCSRSEFVRGCPPGVQVLLSSQCLSWSYASPVTRWQSITGIWRRPILSLINLNSCIAGGLREILNGKRKVLFLLSSSYVANICNSPATRRETTIWSCLLSWSWHPWNLLAGLTDCIIVVAFSHHCTQNW